MKGSCKEQAGEKCIVGKAGCFQPAWCQKLNEFPSQQS